jgi:hypothetical protein
MFTFQIGHFASAVHITNLCMKMSVSDKSLYKNLLSILGKSSCWFKTSLVLKIVCTKIKHEYDLHFTIFTKWKKVY